MTNYVYGVESFEKRAEKYKVVTHDLVRNVDACVIGSGAAGAIIATKLAEAGKSVVLLERGGYYDGESMNQREEDMIPLLWKNAAANFTSNLRLAIAQGSCLGGSTVINDAVCFRMPDLVIEQWRATGVSITKKEWDQANDEVSKRINVKEVTEDELNANARKLREACEKFRIDGKPIKHWNNRRNCGPSFTDPNLTKCVKCGFCHLGCHYDTKQSMLVTYIHDALNNPAANYTAYCNCEVERITYEDGVATGVDGIFRDASGNEKFRIRVNAKLVVVSAGAIASSNLLHKSKIGGEKVGKGLAVHPAPFVMGHFKGEIRGNQGIPMSYTCHEFGVTNGIKKGGFLIESIFLPIFQMAIAIPTFGADHFRMMKEFNNYTMAGIMVRDEPVGEVSMSYGGSPKVRYELSAQTINDMARGMGILARMWFDVGATSIITSHRDVPEIRTRADIPKLKDAVRNSPDGLMLGSAHPQGGNKMGGDENESTVDSDCRVFGFKNLYVCDASVFPTALGVNPQLTVMALATITANRMVKNWNSFPKVKESLGSTCHISQPRFCNAETIGEIFAVMDHDAKLFPKLANSAEKKPAIGKNWSFDSKTLRIYNDLYWRGFYARDTDALTNLLRYFGGFYKKFWKVDDTTHKGITHPFETQIVDAKSIAKEKEVTGFGKVIHLEYEDFPFSTAYDLLKMVDENTIIGKAFVGPFGKGRELFNFSMSRAYDVDFVSEEDLITIFNSNELSHAPTAREIAGRWEGMLVSDSAVTPRAQIFYFDYEDGEIDMRYSFANMLHGRSDVRITDKLFRFDDPTPFHDELRMVTPDLVVGRWVTEWSSEDALQPFIEDFRRILPIPFSSAAEPFLDRITRTLNVRGARLPKEAGVSFLGVEEDKIKGTRIGLSYVLKRIA
ncbi:MAG: GMC family oxidoreductase [Thaumarchaeota archaeon]|nr:GMC family oxidoreductase [Nitrososphaerota archaeon]